MQSSLLHAKLRAKLQWGDPTSSSPRHCKVPKLHRYCTGICQDVTAYAMGSLQAVQRVAGTVVSAGAWPLIRAGVSAKHPAPADHMEAHTASSCASQQNDREDGPSGIMANFGRKVGQCKKSVGPEFKPHHRKMPDPEIWQLLKQTAVDCVIYN